MDIVRTLYGDPTEVNELEAAFPILVIYGAYCFEIPWFMCRDVQRRFEQIGETKRQLESQMSKLELENLKDKFATRIGNDPPIKLRRDIAISLANVLMDDQMTDKDDLPCPIQHLGGNTFIYESEQTVRVGVLN